MVKTQALLTLATLAAVSAFAPQQMPGNVRVIDGETWRNWKGGTTHRRSLGIVSRGLLYPLRGIMSHDLSL